MMFCPNCGTENPAQGKFCKSCGNPLSQEQTAPTVQPDNNTQPEQKKSRKRGVLVAILSGVILLILVAAVIAGAFLLGKHDNLDGVEQEQNESALIEEVTQTTDETIETTTTTTITTTTTEPKPDPMTIYAPILDFYYNNIQAGWQGYDPRSDNTTAGLVNDTDYTRISAQWVDTITYGSMKTLEEVCYQFIDINDDGTDELVIGNLYREPGSGVDFYTYYDGQIVHLCSAYYRTFCFVTSDHAVRISDSQGIRAGFTTYYHLENGKLVPFEEFSFEAPYEMDSSYSYTNTFNSSNQPENRQPITEEEYAEQGGHELREFDMISFSEYRSEQPVDGDATESTLKAAVAAEGEIGLWEYHDYDGDGQKEAFAVILSADRRDETQIDSIWFVDAAGTISKMPEDFHSLSYYTYDQEHYTEYAGKGFFHADYGAYGSGWKTMLYSVKDGKPYQLDIAPNLQGFYYEDGRFYTTRNEHAAGGGHSYPEVDLVYDAATQQFRFQ